MPEQNRHPMPGWLIALVILWGLSAIADLLWLTLDRAIPSWDPADHLIGSLNYWWSLQHAQWLSGDWWHSLWTLSSKYPPLLYIATAPFISLLGRDIEPAILVNLLFTALLLGSVFGLGTHLFSRRVGLWAAGLCLLFPRFYTVRTEYFMDYPLTALVAASFLCLTLWRDAQRAWQQWLWAIAFGVWFGLALLMKQSALFFLAIPLLWVAVGTLQQRAWGRFAQLVVASIITLLMFMPWLQTNWLFQISAGFNSNVKSAIAEGDPPLNTIAAWIFYVIDLPNAVSWPLFIVPVLGLGFYWLKLLPHERDRQHDQTSLQWLAVFFAGSYLLWSAIFNKDFRYIMPYLPVVAVVLGYGLTRWSRRWRSIRWGTVCLATVLTLLNLFPVGGTPGRALAQALSPGSRHYPDMHTQFPIQTVVDEIIQAQPYQIVNLGLLHSTALLNQHNVTYYGNRRDFRVYARRISNNDRHLDQDVRSMSWFLSKTQERSPSAQERRRQNAVLQTLRDSPEFRRFKSWELPDGSRLNLFHRRVPAVEVQPLSNIDEITPSGNVQLTRIIVPSQVPPGQPVPITYEWIGSWEQLHSGLVLLNWRNQATLPRPQSMQNGWIHDHAIGLGTLHPQPIQANQFISARATVEPHRPFRVTERTAMLPPSTLSSGTYMLEATYLNRETGETYPIDVPLTTTIAINTNAVPIPAPELDWVSQLRLLAKTLPDGVAALDPVFDQLGRINLYDPVQNYTVQAEKTLAYRLQQEPQNLDYAYGLALARVLQRQVQPAIAALKQIVDLDNDNPNAHAYLAFVNLYAFRPGEAKTAIEAALELNPGSAEFQAIDGIASLLRGNVWQAWQRGQTALKLSSR
ncbi:glycosyltransferase family 39 protein [Oculatella sp. LEGE 06141]|nr:glycosyltransferase family 39 protein [Oculatella sp. LEGE 06141]